MGCCVFGRLIMALAFLQTSHNDLDIVVTISFIELQRQCLVNNFKMSQIKSYLSIDSVPSQEFRTPAKVAIQHMSTNNSLSFSNTMGSLDNKSSWNRRTFYRSNELEKDFGYQARDFVEEQEEEMENVSSVTLNPVVTQGDLYEFVNSVKIVAFLSKECEDKRAIISNKEKAIKKLQSQIFLIEQRAKFQKWQFQKKEKTVKSRSLSLHKYKKLANEKIQRDIIDMKLQIGRMKRTLSSKKASLEIKRVTSTNEKRRSMPMDSNRSDRKIYVPIYSNQAYCYPHELTQQRHLSRSDYNPMVPPNSMRNYPVQLENSQSYHIKKQNSIENNIINSIKKTPKSMFPPTQPRGQEAPAKELNTNNIFELLHERLQMPNLLTGMNQPFQNGQPNPEIAQTPNYQIPKITLNQQTIHYSRNRVVEKSSNNLDYFNDEFGDEDLKEELMNSQKSKKSIKNLKQSSRSMTNKWKKDNEDEEIVELLKESISDLHEKRQFQTSQKKQSKRSEMGIKLVVTTTINQQNSLDKAHLGINPTPNAREGSINNGSQVQILIENSDEKKANDSRDSSKRFSAKNIDRVNIANSQIGIILQDMNDSIEDLPLSIESKIQSPRKNGLSLYKQVPKIDEVEDEFPKTPVDFKIMNNLEPSFQSRYTITPREVQSAQMAYSHGSNLSKEDQSLNTPPLSRPPSLLEQDDEEDIIDSIKLTGNSRHFQETPVSKLSKIVHDPVQEEQQDFLGTIRLVAMSRISREKNSQKSLKESDLLQSPSNEGKMTHSQLAPLSNPMNDESNGMEIIDSELRKSTNSVIIKKGSSAIQRSVNRKDQSSIKQSNRASTLSSKSNELSTPIEQAEEEQEDVSSIVRRHNRNMT